ncbi:hypothetical protein ACN28S_50535 [Cystobacter fuscus]
MHVPVPQGALEDGEDLLPEGGAVGLEGLRLLIPVRTLLLSRASRPWSKRPSVSNNSTSGERTATSHMVSKRRTTLPTEGAKSGGPTNTQEPVAPSSVAFWVWPPSV